VPFNINVPSVPSIWGGESIQMSLSLAVAAGTQLYVTPTSSASGVICSPAQLSFTAGVNSTILNITVLAGQSSQQVTISWATSGTDQAVYATPMPVTFAVYQQGSVCPIMVSVFIFAAVFLQCRLHFPHRVQ